MCAQLTKAYLLGASATSLSHLSQILQMAALGPIFICRKTHTTARQNGIVGGAVATK